MRFQECTDGNGDVAYRAGTMSCSAQFSNETQRLACLHQITSYYCYSGSGGSGGTAGGAADAGTAGAAGGGGVKGTAGTSGSSG